MLPVTVPPSVNAGVVVPQNGVPVALERKNDEIDVVESPVPPFPTASGVPDQFELLTVLRVAREPRPNIDVVLKLRDDVAITPTEPLVPNKSPDNEPIERPPVVDVPVTENTFAVNELAEVVARVLVPSTARVPVAFIFKALSRPVKNPFPLNKESPTTVRG